MLRGGKPALLFPIGWQIVVQMGWSRGKWKRTPLLGWWFLGSGFGMLQGVSWG